MTSLIRPTLRMHSFIAYITIVCIVIVLDLIGIPWEENIKILLQNYEQISRYFFIGSIVLIFFRLLTVKQKGLAPETRKIRSGLGPIVDLAALPLFDASLFSASLFMLYSIFQERAQRLSLDSFFVLLGVAMILLYLSVNDMIRMGREIFYVQTAERVVRE